jgi:hypothetical protein
LKSQQVAIVNEQFVNLTDSQATVTCTWQVAFVGSAGGQSRSCPRRSPSLTKNQRRLVHRRSQPLGRSSSSHRRCSSGARRSVDLPSFRHFDIMPTRSSVWSHYDEALRDRGRGNVWDLDR